MDGVVNDLSKALIDRLRIGIEREGWECVSLGTRRAISPKLRDWLRDELGIEETHDVILAVLQKPLETK